MTQLDNYDNLLRMQTLGLSDEPKRSDGWLKSIFWPTVENAWDVDYLGQQGFWICFVIAVVTLAFSLLTGSILLMMVGLFAALVYWVGGMGVREKNWIAATIIFACFLLDTLVAMLQFGLMPIVLVRILLLGVLLTNIRATFLASEWKPAADDEDRPTRFNDGIKDKLVDTWPPKLWRALQIPFYGFSALWLLLSLLGLLYFLAVRLGLVHQ